MPASDHAPSVVTCGLRRGPAARAWPWLLLLAACGPDEPGAPAGTGAATSAPTSAADRAVEPARTHGDGSASAPAVPPAAIGTSTPPAARTLLLVTLDTTRADHLGCYGHAEAATPVLDDLATRGVLFEQAYAPTPITMPSHASILSGVLPAVHGVRDNGQFVLSDEALLVSEVLSDAGWRSAAFVASFVLDESFGLAQGFEHYGGASTTDLGAQAHFNERPAAAVVDETLAWAGGCAPDDDLFLWVHFYDPHWPYVPPADWQGAPYDGEIAACDAQLGRLLSGLAAQGRGDGLVSVVTADHGESLGERGETSHGVFLYESAVRVPLIVSGAGLGEHAGARVAGPVSVTAIAPTLLTLAGLATTALPRCSEPALLDDAGAPRSGDPRRPLVLETWYPFNSYGWHPLEGLVWNGHKLIRGAATEVYELDSDPSEQRDLASTRSALAANMAAQLDAALADAVTAGWTEQRTLDATERERLAALGYAGGGASAHTGSAAERLAAIHPGADLPDGRDLIGDTAVLDTVRTLLAEVQGLQLAAPPADPTAAQRRATETRALLLQCRQLLEPLQTRHPGNPMAAAYRGTVESALGDIQAALPHLELAARSNPRDPALRYTLGASYQQVGRLADSLHEMLATLTIEPRYTAALNWMVWYRAQAGQFGRALWWAERFLAQIPETDPGRAAVATSVANLRAQMVAAGQSLSEDGDYPLDDLSPREQP